MESLFVLLSQTLVTFTIEYDNEFEVQGVKYARPWFLTSIVMWSNFMRYVTKDGTPVSEISARSGIRDKRVASVVGGMERWGYIVVDHDPAKGVPARRKGFGSASGVKGSTVIYPSIPGEAAARRWQPLAEEIERRWRSRFGSAVIDRLRSALDALLANVEIPAPHFLPVVGGGFFARDELIDAEPETDDELPALLARSLLALTLATEERTPVPLPIGANLLRVANEEGTLEKDLPLATGTSKEAVSASMTWLKNAGCITVEPNPRGRGKLVRVTAEGVAKRNGFAEACNAAESDWDERFGVGDLRSTLDAVLGNTDALRAGLETPPGGWRGTKRYAELTQAFIDSPRESLPRYPMVLHRGGWPDGS